MHVPILIRYNDTHRMQAYLDQSASGPGGGGILEHFDLRTLDPSLNAFSSRILKHSGVKLVVYCQK